MTKAADIADIARGLAPFSGAIHERSGDVFCYFAGFNLSEFARRVTAQADAPAIQPQRMPDREKIIQSINGVMVSHNGYTSPMLVDRIADAMMALTRPECPPTEKTGE